MKNYTFGLIFMLCAAFLTQAKAETYYVNASHTNASDNNAGTNPEEPWATLNTAKWTESGGTINLAPGNYYLTVETLIKGNTELIGSSQEEVVILSMDDEDFEEDRFGNAPLTERFFTTDAGINLTVKNLTMKNLRFGNAEATPETGGMLNTGEGSVLLVENVTFKHAIVPKGANAVVNAKGPVTLTNVLIQDCHLEETADPNDAIVCVGSGETTASKLTMEKVRIFDCSSSGGSIVCAKQGGNGNSELYVNNCTLERNNYATWGSALRGVCRDEGKLIFHLTNSFFMDNQGVSSGVTFIQSDGDEANKELDVLFYNNTFIKNYRDGGHSSVYQSNDDGQAWIKGTFSFVNNTLLNNCSSEAGKNGNAFLFVQTPNAEFNFINNLIMTEEGEGAILFTLPDHREDHEKMGIGTITGNMTERTGGGENTLVLAVTNEENGNYVAPEQQGEGEEIQRQPLSELISFGEIVRPVSGNAPYLPVLAGSFNIDKAKSHDLVPALDSRGAGIYNEIKDIGSYEYNPDFKEEEGGGEEGDGIALTPVDNDKISVYPNPFSNIINISEQVSQIEIFNLNGSLAFSTYNVSQVDVSDLKKGLYLVRLTSLDGKTTTIKMLK